MIRTLSLALAAVLLLAALPAAPLGAQLPPDARWWSFDTPHFRVHYTEGLEPVARRAAERAERAYTEVAELLVRPPEGKVELLVADNVDYANGYATPFPTNRIVIYAQPPVAEPTLSYYDDWLELVITHELTHIFHLDYARGVWGPLRSVFGRVPLFFPAAIAPGWVTEGLATYAESELTRAGRVRGTTHEMVLRTALLEDRFFSIARATGTPATWPGPSTRYVYGSLFVAHLAERYGEERVGEFVRALGGSLLPYRLNAAARAAFGVSFTRAWREWEAELRDRWLPVADSLRAAGLTEPEVLTEAGRYAFFPRWSPDGALISYAAATGRERAATRLILPDGSERTLERRNSLGPASWLPGGEGLVLSQLDYEDPYHVLADVYRVGLDGSERKLTDAARLTEPSVAPDGRRVVGVRSAGGTNALVLLDLETGALRPLRDPDLTVHWSLPRWSPAGDRIAAARWTVGGYFDVVVLDSAGRELRALTRDRAVDAAPAWSPDGRYVLFSSDRTGITNLYAYDLEADRLFQVTNVLTGAFQPDVSPDGRWIVFSWYRADGYHVARIPFDPAGWRPAPPVSPRFDAPPPDTAAFHAVAGGAARPYSPWRSLAPAGWMPLLAAEDALGFGLGAAVFGEDVVGRHAYDAYALAYPDGRRVEGELSYQYRGLGTPLLGVGAAQGWSVLLPEGERVRVGGEELALPTALLDRERTLGASLTFPRPRIRSYAWWSVGGEWTDRDLLWRDDEAAEPVRGLFADLPPEVGALLTAGYSTVREFDFSISPEEGFLAAGSLEGFRFTRPHPRTGESSGYLRFVGRSRAFHALDPGGFARHVLAARLSAGAEAGPRSPGLRVGGAGGGASPLSSVLDLGRSLTFPVRGYPEGAQRGDRAWSASAEYRFPLALVERGVGVLPFFLDRLWGSAFADAGAAWCGGACERFPGAPRSPDPLYSVGAELGVDLSAGYFLGMQLRGGVAVPLGPASPSPELYLRFGRSF